MKYVAVILGVTLIGLPMLAFDQETGSPGSSQQHKLINVLTEELNHSMQNLATEDGTKPYYLGYTITDTSSVSIRGRLGALYGNDTNRRRVSAQKRT